LHDPLKGESHLKEAPLTVVPSDDLIPIGSPVAVNPAGRDIAGFDMKVTYQ
jgi:hypothetical protein